MPHMLETLLMLIILIAIASLLIWAIQTYLLVIPGTIRGVLCFLVVVAAILFIYQRFAGSL